MLTSGVYPQEKRENFISRMRQQELIDENAAQYLQRNLPEFFQKNWNAVEGLYLARKSYNNSLTYKAILSFYHFPSFPNFRQINYS